MCCSSSLRLGGPANGDTGFVACRIHLKPHFTTPNSKNSSSTRVSKCSGPAEPWRWMKIRTACSLPSTVIVTLAPYRPSSRAIIWGQLWRQLCESPLRQRHRVVDGVNSTSDYVNGLSGINSPYTKTQEKAPGYRPQKSGNTVPGQQPEECAG